MSNYHIFSPSSKVSKLFQFVSRELAGNDRLYRAFLKHYYSCHVSFFWTRRRYYPRYKLLNCSDYSESSKEFAVIDELCDAVNEILYYKYGTR